MFKAILFDLDETIIHTKCSYRYKIIKEVLRELKINNLERNNFKRFADKFWFEEDRDQTIEEFLKIDASEFWDVFNRLDVPEKRAKAITIYKDIDFLDKLKSLGMKTAIVTGAHIRILNMYLDLIGREKFDQIVVANPLFGIQPKPSPEGIILALERLKASPKESLYVGNSEGDLIAARKAGVYDVFIDRGAYEVRFKNIEPSKKIKTLYELSDLLQI